MLTIIHFLKKNPNRRAIQIYSKLLSRYNCPVEIRHQTQETTTILQFHSKVVRTFSRDRVLVYPDVKIRMRTATETITANMLQTVWNELDYLADVCRITKDAHLEHL